MFLSAKSYDQTRIFGYVMQCNAMQCHMMHFILFVLSCNEIRFCFNMFILFVEIFHICFIPVFDFFRCVIISIKKWYKHFAVVHVVGTYFSQCSATSCHQLIFLHLSPCQFVQPAVSSSVFYCHYLLTKILDFYFREETL